jgi:hypothetical protein
LGSQKLYAALWRLRQGDHELVASLCYKYGGLVSNPKSYTLILGV